MHLPSNNKKPAVSIGNYNGVNMKISAQQVCDILNQNLKTKGFLESIRGRVGVTSDVADNSDVMCSVIDGGFDSSPLGFIQALIDEPICLIINKGEECFQLLGDAKEATAETWDKYESDVKNFNELHGTDHKPCARPNDL